MLKDGLPIVDVYIAKIPNEITFGQIAPKAREEEIMACSNLRIQRQKYCAWKLLEYALKNSFGIPMSAMKFKKSVHGRWSTSSVCFSITHCKDWVAVAVSKEKVGLDLEERCGKLSTASRRFLTEQETLELQSLQESEKLDYLAKKWTQKESIFKAFGEGGFMPARISTDDYDTLTKEIEDGFLLTVATKTKVDIRYFKDVVYY